MSQPDRENPRTERQGQDRLEASRYGRLSEAVRPATDRELHYESPTKYDIDFYQRKVNRLEGEVNSLQEELSLNKYRLQKAEDFEAKYEQLFRQHQNTNEDLDNTRENLLLKTRQSNDLKVRLEQANMRIKNLENDVQSSKNTTEDVKKRNDDHQSKTSSQEEQRRTHLEQQYLKQIDNLKAEGRSREQRLKKELKQAQFLISSQENTQNSLKFKLDRIKQEKNDQIQRLKQALSTLKEDLSKQKQSNDSKLTNNRTLLIEETQGRVHHLRNLSTQIQATLLEEIKNLNETLRNKDTEIAFLLKTDKEQIEENEQIQNDLKAHIRRLQDKIFIIQRQNEIELFNTIQRLRNQYEQNISELNRNFDQIRAGHKDQVQDLNQRIKDLQRELSAVSKEARNWEDQHKQLSLDKEISVKMLSQKIIGLEKLKDDDLKIYTTSMRHIEQEAKSKLDDLHNAVLNKNTEFEILNAQLVLKNQQINYLIEEINKLRNENREKMRKLETTNSLEQNSLNEQNSALKKQILQLKRRNHELEAQISDITAQAKMKNDLSRQELNSAKQANALLMSRNDFLVQWCKQLEGDLKKQRISNVDILQDHTTSRRETIQIREQVKVQLQAIKDREVDQIRNVFKLEKGRLESDLIKRDQEISSLKADNNRLLVEYKNLERKLGKPSKIDKGEQENGKCKATLEAQILLTENIFNAINKF